MRTPSSLLCYNGLREEGEFALVDKQVRQRADAQDEPNRLAAAITPFSWAFLGLAAIRIWIQCTMYDRYAFTDAGVTSIIINLVRVAFTGLLVLVVLKVGFPAQARKLLGWFSVTAMTLASILFLLDAQIASLDFNVIACVCAGLGIVWGSGSWMEFYLRLHPEEALTYTLLSLALGSACGMVLGFLPSYVGWMISIIMPTISFVTCSWSLRLLDARDDATPIDTLDPAPIDTRYDSEPRSTFIRLLIGLALFEFAIGVARGFPFGESFELAPGFQALHQLAVIALCGFGLYLVLYRDRFIRYSTLWRFELALVAAGVILLATLNWLGLSFGSTCIAIANSTMLGLLWYSCYDIARHTKMIPYAVLGICWFVFLLAREVGRWFIMGLAPHDEAVIIIITLMVVLLTVCIAVMFGDSIPCTRELFEDLRIEVDRDASARKRAAALADAPQTPHPVDLAAVYGLTQREVEVIDGIMQGKSKASVGAELFISENTVRGYVKNAYTKMDVHNKQELSRKYYD